MDLGDEILARARAAADRGPPAPPTAAELEALRVEALEQLALLPEPPAYRRANDPDRDRAQKLLAGAEALLERALRAEKSVSGPPRLEQARAIASSAEAQLAALAAIAQGQIVRGEDLASLARARSQAMNELAAAFHRIGARDLPIFDRATGASRYDPHDPERLEVTLPCPDPGCRQQARYALATRTPTHRFQCTACHRPFVGYFGEVRSVEQRAAGQDARHALRVEELGGRERTIEIDDASGAQLPVAPRDLVALIYARTETLAAVENLSTSRVLWIQPRGACFLATAAYGEGAPELAVFRAFRDQRLLPHRWGRWSVRGYYSVGPILARPVRRSPLLRRAVRFGLERVRRRILRRELAP